MPRKTIATPKKSIFFAINMQVRLQNPGEDIYRTTVPRKTIATPKKSIFIAINMQVMLQNPGEDIYRNTVPRTTTTTASIRIPFSQRGRTFIEI